MTESVRNFSNFIAPYDVIVWDWNGTLLNDAIHTHQVICKILEQEGLTPITMDEYRQCFGFPISKYYASLGLPSEGPEFDRVAQLFVNGYRQFNNDLKLYNDSISLLQAVHGLEKSQYVLSAAQYEDLKMQMGKFDIMKYFKDISGSTDIYAHGKIDQAKKMKLYFQSQGYKSGLYIGDTDHDYDVSRVLDFDFCFSAEGHQCATKTDLTKVSYVLSNRNQ
jgi:phosphoglycolate phosphatase